MAHSPRVSVICVTYNQERYIRQTLDGFLAQKTKFPFEVIVADDCSNDGTPTIIKEYAKSYPNIFKPILRKKNVGILDNFYDSMRTADGEYLAICEGDDYWTDPQKLQKQVDFLDKNTEYSMCFHPVKVHFENGDSKDYISPDPEVKKTFTQKELIERNFIQTNSVMYRRQSYDAMPKKMMPVDWYLHLYHAQFGKIGFINEVMSVYRRHPGGVWWGSQANLNKTIIKHGTGWLGLHANILKLYSKNPDYRKIIEGSIINTFRMFVESDKKYHSALVLQALVEFPETGEVYINDLLKEVTTLSAHSIEQAKIIDHYVSLSQKLEAENNYLAIHPLKRFRGEVRQRLKRVLRPENKKG
ncbi:MAG: glycosyl transferase [Candidatus Saccharibacteria bacterium]|nr:glycosyl transferase [Candidatus Saccharibacteria bacterium]